MTKLISFRTQLVQFDHCLVVLCLGTCNLVQMYLAFTVTITPDQHWNTRYQDFANWMSCSCHPRLVDLSAPKRIVCMYFKKAVAHSVCAETYTDAYIRSLKRSVQTCISVTSLTLDILDVAKPPSLTEKHCARLVGLKYCPYEILTLMLLSTL